jgi:glyoxylate reductase
MAKAKVLATHRLFEPARKILQNYCEVEYWEKSERPPREEVLRRVKDKDAMVCLLTEQVNDELLQAAPKLKIAANVAVGFDNIDVAACTKRGVAATNTPGVLDETTADFAWTLLMAVARRLLEGDALARPGDWKGWDLDQLVGTDVWGKTLGIVGFGRIGRAMARRASGFQMKVIYTDAVRAAPNVERELGAEYRDMNALLAEADFIRRNRRGGPRNCRPGSKCAGGPQHHQQKLNFSVILRRPVGRAFNLNRNLRSPITSI